MALEIIKCPGIYALQRLEELRGEYSATGKYPFLIGRQESLSALTDFPQFTKSESKKILSDAINVNLPAWFKTRAGEEWYEELDANTLLGSWPSHASAPTQITAHKNIVTGNELPLVYLGLVPIEKPWHLPAMVKFGMCGFNACPDTIIHCALMRHWNERYGAEIISLSGAVLECKVTSPPIQQDDAVALAWEQFWYCSDNVYQGTKTISNLAATLLKADCWYFWWD